jgi:pimeloyl-ACP methyl ester carboxylesterase
MDLLEALGRWISDNESLLSGLAALIVVAGVILSPIGGGFRRLRGNDRGRRSAEQPSGPSATAMPGDRPAARETISLQALTEPVPYPIRFADSEGVRIAYLERGKGPIDLVVVPGIISHLHICSHLPPIRDTMAALDAFAHVVVFDKRGQGLSDPTLVAPSVEERSEDIGAVMDAAGLERAVLFGISEGGPTCLRFAYDHPERVQGLILVGTAASFEQRPDFPIGIASRALDSLPRRWGRGELRSLFFPSISATTIDDGTFRSALHLMATPDSVSQIVEMMKVTDVRRLLPEVQVPTLVVHFAGDLAMPVRLGRALAEGIPGAEFFEANGVDHADITQSPEALARIRAFCERVVVAA